MTPSRSTSRRARAPPYVILYCYQGGPCRRGSEGYFDGLARPNRNFGLSLRSWQGGGGRLHGLARGPEQAGWSHLASTSFHVDGVVPRARRRAPHRSGLCLRRGWCRQPSFGCGPSTCMPAGRQPGSGVVRELAVPVAHGEAPGRFGRGPLLSRKRSRCVSSIAGPTVAASLIVGRRSQLSAGSEGLRVNVDEPEVGPGGTAAVGRCPA